MKFSFRKYTVSELPPLKMPISISFLKTTKNDLHLKIFCLLLQGQGQIYERLTELVVRTCEMKKNNCLCHFFLCVTKHNLLFKSTILGFKVMNN